MIQKSLILDTSLVQSVLKDSKQVHRLPIQSKAKNLQCLGQPCIDHRAEGDPWYGDKVWSIRTQSGAWADYSREEFLNLCPYKKGDYVWVRETFATLHCGDYSEISPWDRSCQETRFKASERPEIANESDHEVRGYRWRPSSQMPKHCSRLTLKVLDVNVEPIQKITPKEALREGFSDLASFAFYWTQKYQKCGLGWDNNPFAWVIEFEPIRQNISQI